MTKLGIGRILEKRASKEPQPTPPPEPTVAEVFEQAQTIHSNVVSKLRDARTQLAGNQRDLEGIEGTISRAIDLDARKGGGFYTEAARTTDQKRLADLTQAVAEDKKTVKTLEGVEAKTAEVLAQAEVVFLLSEIRRHESDCKVLQDRLFAWRDAGTTLFQELKAEAEAAEICSADYVGSCRVAGVVNETHGFAQLLTTWRMATDTLKGQR